MVNSSTTLKKFVDVNNYTNTHRNFLLYGLIGGIGVSLDTSIFLLLRHLEFNYLAANFIGYSAGTCTSFLLNRKYNFKKLNLIHYRFLLFVTIAGIGFTTSAILLYIFVNEFNLSAEYAKFFTLIPVIFLQFMLNRRYSFR
jgi:putative flippase GtrA